MGAQNDGVPLAQFMNQVADFNNLQRVKADGRLVQNDVRRVAQQCLRNANALAVALGQGADQPVCHLGQAGFVNHAGNLVGNVFAGNPFGLCHKAEVFQRRLLGVERRDFRQIPQQPFGLLRILKNVAAVNQHSAVRGGKAAGHNVHRG